MESKVQSWINKAGEVWCKKAGIRLVPHPKIEKINMPPNPGQKDSDYIEVYLTKGTLSEDTNGGETFGCGTNEAYIILDIDKIGTNDFLFAHELGHVLDITHPTGSQCADLLKGSRCSVMTPGKEISNRNTEHNIGVLGINQIKNLLLNPPFFKTTSMCKWDPDPDTDGPVFRELWNSSQPLHNSYKDSPKSQRRYKDLSLVFDQNDSPETNPIAGNPKRGSKNHVCIRLNECQIDGKPIDVYFYAAKIDPQAKLIPLEGSNGPHVTYEESNKKRIKTNDFEWSVPTDLGTVDECYIFAVAVIKDNPSSEIEPIISNPTQHKHQDLFNLIGQGDIHVKERKFTIDSIPV